MSLFARKDRCAKSSLVMCVLMSCLMCSIPSTSFAQDSKEQRMQSVSDAAMEKFQKSQFDEAAKGFEDAYAIYPQSVLLKNATVAWFSAGQCDEAERTAVSYLDATKPQAKNLLKDRRDVRTVVARCRLRSAKVAFNNDDLAGARQSLDGIELYSPEGDDAQSLIDIRKLIQARQAEIDAKKRDPKVEKTDDGSQNGKVITPAAPAGPSPGLLYTGSSLAGVGGLGLLLTRIAVTKPGLEDRKQYDRDCVPIRADNEERCKDLSDDLSDISRNEKVLYVASGVVTAAGVALITVYFVKKNKAKEQSVFLLPEVTPDRAGASVLLRF